MKNRLNEKNKNYLDHIEVYDKEVKVEIFSLLELNEKNFETILMLPCKTELYRFGLASLHFWNRTMKYILHISYSLCSVRFLEYTNIKTN